MANITLTPVVQQTLETVMKKEVVEIVSNNVLKKQFKQFHLIDASKCRIFSQMENMFSVIEERTIPISNIWNITRSAFATVEWNEEKDKVRCSCNKLVYRGMPCMHILCVAKDRSKKIPLNCFNERFFCQVPTTIGQSSEQEVADPLTTATPPTGEREQRDQQPITTLLTNVHLPDEDLQILKECQNIVYSNMFSHNGDSQSMDIFAKCIVLQTWISEGLKPLTTYDEVMKMLTKWEDDVKDRIKELRAETEPAYGVSNCATENNTRNSWKDVPREVLSRAQKMLYQSLKQGNPEKDKH